MFKKAIYLLSLFVCLSTSFSEAMNSENSEKVKATFDRLPQKPNNTGEENNFNDMNEEEANFPVNMNMDEEEENDVEENKDQYSNKNSYENIFSEKNIYKGPQNSPENSPTISYENLFSGETKQFTMSPRKELFFENIKNFEKITLQEASDLLDKRIKGTITTNEAIDLFCYSYREYEDNATLFQVFRIFFWGCDESIAIDFHNQSSYMKSSSPGFFANIILDKLEVYNNISFNKIQRSIIINGLKDVVKHIILKQLQQI